MSKYLREKFRDYEAYTPGEQPKDGEYIKLNTNESPYPPGVMAQKALGRNDLEDLRLYPSPTQMTLKENLAELYGLKAENFCVSNGSDDIISYAFAAFCGDEKPAVFPDITYGFYQVFSDYYGTEKNIKPLGENLEIKVEDYLDLPKPGMIVIANPNAPTGLALGLDEIETIIKANPGSVILVDEAYADFGDTTVVPLIEKYENLLVSRTFSKSSSLAGARLGYGIGSSALIEDLEIMKYSTNPYSVNRMTELVGLAVLKEPDYYRNNIRRIVEAREWTKDRLREMGIEFLDSKANFIFVKTGEGSYEAFKDKGVLVRWFRGERTKDYIRVSIGTKEDMAAFIEALKEIRGEK